MVHPPASKLMTWSMSQVAASVLQPGNRQVPSRSMTRRRRSRVGSWRAWRSVAMFVASLYSVGCLARMAC